MIHFGTGGWRAIIGEDFTKANIRKVAAAILKIIEMDGLKKEMVVGYDSRFLSRESAIWFSEVLASGGVKIHFINKSQPTPLIMFSTMKLGYDFGAMITSSHNPAIYNGIKVFTTGGRDAIVEVTKRIEKLANELEVGETLSYDELCAKGSISQLDLFNDYIDAILEKVNVEAIKKARLRICLDPMFGVSQTSLRTILCTLRCNLSVINDAHDTLFGRRLPAPESGALFALKRYVIENECDFGIATDGDADRIGLIDDKGEYVHANQILCLLYYYLLSVKGMRGDVVRNNSTTSILDKIASAYGQKCHEVPVGIKYITSKMNETRAIIGGESSGGLTIKGHINGKDGIFAASILTEMVALTGKKISELLDEIGEKFGRLVYCDASVKLTSQLKDTLKTRLLENKELPTFPFAIDHISYEDGCKVYFKNGAWIITRFSGTEPLIRFACESSSQEENEKLMGVMKTFFKI